MPFPRAVWNCRRSTFCTSNFQHLVQGIRTRLLCDRTYQFPHYPHDGLRDNLLLGGFDGLSAQLRVLCMPCRETSQEGADRLTSALEGRNAMSSRTARKTQNFPCARENPTALALQCIAYSSTESGRELKQTGLGITREKVVSGRKIAIHLLGVVRTMVKTGGHREFLRKNS